MSLSTHVEDIIETLKCRGTPVTNVFAGKVPLSCILNAFLSVRTIRNATREVAIPGHQRDAMELHVLCGGYTDVHSIVASSYDRLERLYTGELSVAYLRVGGSKPSSSQLPTTPSTGTSSTLSFAALPAESAPLGVAKDSVGGVTAVPGCASDIRGASTSAKPPLMPFAPEVKAKPVQEVPITRTMLLQVEEGRPPSIQVPPTSHESQLSSTTGVPASADSKPVATPTPAAPYVEYAEALLNFLTSRTNFHGTAAKSGAKAWPKGESRTTATAPSTAGATKHPSGLETLDALAEALGEGPSSPPRDSFVSALPVPMASASSVSMSVSSSSSRHSGAVTSPVSIPRGVDPRTGSEPGEMIPPGDRFLASRTREESDLSMMSYESRRATWDEVDFEEPSKAGPILESIKDAMVDPPQLCSGGGSGGSAKHTLPGAVRAPAHSVCADAMILTHPLQGCTCGLCARVSGATGVSVQLPQCSVWTSDTVALKTTAEDHKRYMRRAIEIARQNALVDKNGGPFGCVIVKDGEIIAEGVNHVIAWSDPTSHGEMNAIRNACKALRTHVLDGCTLYTSAEPCPMCYGASWWARIEHIYYAGTIADSRDYGDFDDDPIYKAVRQAPQDRLLQCTPLLRDEMLETWKDYRAMDDRPRY